MLSIYAEATADRQGLVLLADGPVERVAWAAKSLMALPPLFKPTDPAGALKGPLTWPTVLQLSQTFGDSWLPQPALQAWINEQVSARLAPVGGESLPQWLTLPPGLVPRDYQIAGAYEIARTGRCFLFDEPRVGKTVTAILGLRLTLGETPAHDHGGLPVIVVCPASVVDPWVQHFRAWWPELETVAWMGPKRKALFGQADVYVTSYDTARRDAAEMTTTGEKDPLVKLGAPSLIVDEVHQMKNPTAHRTRAVKRLATISGRLGGAYVGLSGTPITHHPADLWLSLECLAPGSAPSRERWVTRYCSTVPADYGGEEILGLAQHFEPEFRLSIEGQHRRVARADVMSQLPPKVYSTRVVEMPEKWRKVYDDFEAEMLAELPDGETLSVMSVLAQLTHLSGLASAPADVETTYETDPETGEDKQHVHLTLKAPSWKVEALLEILGERCGPDVPAEARDRVVCFAPSRQLMGLAGQAAEARGYRVGYIIGGQSRTARTQTIEAFQNGELDLVCATTSAGGTGITLSSAGTLVFLQRPWSLVESIQAEDRGEGDLTSTRGTEIIDVLTERTIDTRVRSVLRERAGQLSDLLQDRRIVEQLLGGSNPTSTRKAS